MFGSKKLLLGIAFVVALSLCLGVADARANLVLGSAILNGAQEVPPSGSVALGSAAMNVDEDTGLFDFNLFVTGLTSADLVGAGANSTPIHIHSAPAGANGSIVVDVAFQGTIDDIGTTGVKLTVEGGTFGGAQGAVNSDTATNISDLLAGNLYINIHTEAAPGGEIRGQIVPLQIPEPSTVALSALGLLGLAVIRRRRA